MSNIYVIFLLHCFSERSSHWVVRTVSPCVEFQAMWTIVREKKPQQHPRNDPVTSEFVVLDDAVPSFPGPTCPRGHKRLQNSERATQFFANETMQKISQNCSYSSLTLGVASAYPVPFLQLVIILIINLQQ